MRFWFLVGMLVIGGAACGSDDPPPGNLGEACNVIDDCAAPLECISVGSASVSAKMCTIACAGTAGDMECAALAAGATCVDDERKCMFTCSPGGGCPGGGTCVFVDARSGKCLP